VILRHFGLEKFSFSVARSTKNGSRHRRRPCRVVSAATGCSDPSMPFMQAIGMEKDELVQELGVSSTVATLALASISPPPAC